MDTMKNINIVSVVCDTCQGIMGKIASRSETETAAGMIEYHCATCRFKIMVVHCANPKASMFNEDDEQINYLKKLRQY